MKILCQENLQELEKKVLNLIAQSSVEIGHRIDAKTLATLSKVFAADLIRERRFGEMTFQQVQEAFRQGIRFGKDEPFLNIRLFYKWVWAHKKNNIDPATYEVHTLHKDPAEVPYYQPPIKLLK